MSTLTTEQFSKANEILELAKAHLEAIGMSCLLSSMSLPQGLSVSLCVGETELATIGAHIASSHGAAIAHTKDGKSQFDFDVAERAADLAILRASC